MSAAKNEIIHILNEDTIREIDILKQIANSKLQQNPFYIFNIEDIIKKFKYWNDMLPRVKPYYAVKCNNHPTVLRILSALGTGFDCASKSEIDQVLSIGVEPSRIIFSNPTKLPQYLSYAADTNINLLTFDNEFELFKIHNLHPTARVLIRIRYNAKDSYVRLSEKFGCNSETEAFSLLQSARNLDVNVVGVCFHVGPGCKDVEAFYGAIEAARNVFDIARELNFNFNLLDIGGGYPGDSSEQMFKLSETINFSLKTFFPDDAVKVIAEPGTYFVASAFTLTCCIHSIRLIHDEDSTKNCKEKYMYFLNDGIFESFAHVFSCKAVKIPTTIKELKEDTLYPCILWGPTCDSADRINENVLLPKMELGDWLVFKNMGAYTITTASGFNSFEPTVVYNFISSKNRLLLQNRSCNHLEEVIHDDDSTLNFKKIISNKELVI